MRLQNKVAIITGSSRGIGAATAKLFAEEGAKVVVQYKENKTAAEKVFRSLAGNGHIILRADVSKENEAVKLVEAVMEKYNRIDILVNNAGEIGQRGWTINAKEWQRIIDVNLTSAWLLIRQVAPIMKKQESGAIVNLSSTVARGVAAIMPYSCAKGGIISLTAGFAKELAPHIRVNAVAPSNVKTDMTKSAGPELIEFFRQQTPLKRIADPEELAKVILFLASNDSSYITGHRLVVDGGYSLK